MQLAQADQPSVGEAATSFEPADSDNAGSTTDVFHGEQAVAFSAPVVTGEVVESNRVVSPATAKAQPAAAAGRPPQIAGAAVPDAAALPSDGPRSQELGQDASHARSLVASLSDPRNPPAEPRLVRPQLRPAPRRLGATSTRLRSPFRQSDRLSRAVLRPEAAFRAMVDSAGTSRVPANLVVPIRRTASGCNASMRSNEGSYRVIGENREGELRGTHGDLISASAATESRVKPVSVESDPEVERLLLEGWGLINRGDGDLGRARLQIALGINREDPRVEFSLGSWTGCSTAIGRRLKGVLPIVFASIRTTYHRSTTWPSLRCTIRKPPKREALARTRRNRPGDHRGGPEPRSCPTLGHGRRSAQERCFFEGPRRPIHPSRHCHGD